jgi:hypothetical protein
MLVPRLANQHIMLKMTVETRLLENARKCWGSVRTGWEAMHCTYLRQSMAAQRKTPHEDASVCSGMNGGFTVSLFQAPRNSSIFSSLQVRINACAYVFACICMLSLLFGVCW